MNLREALAEIAHDFDLGSKYTLWDYAQLDPHVGYYDGNPYGTPYTDEGRLLYALVRAIEAVHCFEIGTHYGGSAVHIGQALHDMDDTYRSLWTCDIIDEYHPLLELAPHIHFMKADGNVWVEQLLTNGVHIPYDFIFEDGNHSIYQVELVWKNLDRLLKPGGMIVSHDALSAVDVRTGIRKAGYDYPPVREYLIDPSPCGVAIWRKGLE